jgi:flavin-binding protein dodecin
MPPLADTSAVAAINRALRLSGLFRSSALVWFEVKEQRGRITSGGNIEYQVTLEIGFLLEEPGRL